MERAPWPEIHEPSSLDQYLGRLAVVLAQGPAGEPDLFVDMRAAGPSDLSYFVDLRNPLVEQVFKIDPPVIPAEMPPLRYKRTKTFLRKVLPDMHPTRIDVLREDAVQAAVAQAIEVYISNHRVKDRPLTPRQALVHEARILAYLCAPQISDAAELADVAPEQMSRFMRGVRHTLLQQDFTLEPPKAELPPFDSRNEVFADYRKRDLIAVTLELAASLDDFTQQDAVRVLGVLYDETTDGSPDTLQALDKIRQAARNIKDQFNGFERVVLVRVLGKPEVSPPRSIKSLQSQRRWDKEFAAFLSRKDATIKDLLHGAFTKIIRSRNQPAS